MLKQREAEALRSMNEADAEQLFREAQSDYRAGDMPGAARLARKAIQLYPGHTPCLILLATIHERANQHADALHYCLLARKQLPQEPRVIYNCAMARAGLGQLVEALRDLDQFLDTTQSLPTGGMA
jgi:tetratricopeptide (TPR) repeat protein